MNEATEPVPLRKPFSVTVKVPPGTAKRLFALAMQAQGATQVAQQAGALAEKLSQDYHQAALMALQMKHEGKLPDGNVQIMVDVDENKLTVSEQQGSGA